MQIAEPPHPATQKMTPPQRTRDFVSPLSPISRQDCNWASRSALISSAPPFIESCSIPLDFPSTRTCTKSPALKYDFRSLLGKSIKSATTTPGDLGDGRSKSSTNSDGTPEFSAKPVTAASSHSQA
eukprot:Skav211373  [mRNA]  locus=scaffold2406:49450:54167:- [translate_table: standard]